MPEKKKPTKQQLIKALTKSIKHWRTMQKWVGDQPACGYADALDMESAINQCWGSRDCPLCTLCHIFGTPDCVGCPLGSNALCCAEWQIVHNSRTWGSWLSASVNMVARLERKLAALTRNGKRREKTNKS